MLEGRYEKFKNNMGYVRDASAGTASVDDGFMHDFEALRLSGGDAAARLFYPAPFVRLRGKGGGLGIIEEGGEDVEENGGGEGPATAPARRATARPRTTTTTRRRSATTPTSGATGRAWSSTCRECTGPPPAVGTVSS